MIAESEKGPIPYDASVQIVGDFNNWVPETLRLADLQGRPVWQRAISLTDSMFNYPPSPFDFLRITVFLKGSLENTR